MMNNWINCCGVAIFLAIANVLQLIFFFNYSLKLKDRQVILEKKNGHEQKQIDKLKKAIEKLKTYGNLSPVSKKKTNAKV